MSLDDYGTVNAQCDIPDGSMVGSGLVTIKFSDFLSDDEHSVTTGRACIRRFIPEICTFCFYLDVQACLGRFVLQKYERGFFWFYPKFSMKNTMLRPSPHWKDR